MDEGFIVNPSWELAYQSQASENEPQMAGHDFLEHINNIEHHLDRVIARNGDASGQNADGNPAEIDSIGTWAQRVLFFPSKQDKEKEAQQKALQLTRAESERQEQETPRRQANREEEEAAHAAWRWRFNRRWRHEQVRSHAPLHSTLLFRDFDFPLFPLHLYTFLTSWYYQRIILLPLTKVGEPFTNILAKAFRDAKCNDEA